MITMIVGVITVVAVLVTRMPNANAITEPRALPESIVLPENTTAQAVTLGKDWIGVVSSANLFLLYDRNGTLLQTIELQLPK